MYLCHKTIFRMKTNYQLRYASNPVDAKNYDTKRLRDDFLIERLFADDEVNMVYSMYDRMIVGGAMPKAEELKLEAIPPLKADYFTTRREIGVFNVGGSGYIMVGKEKFKLNFKEALYRQRRQGGGVRKRQCRRTCQVLLQQHYSPQGISLQSGYKERCHGGTHGLIRDKQ